MAISVKIETISQERPWPATPVSGSAIIQLGADYDGPFPFEARFTVRFDGVHGEKAAIHAILDQVGHLVKAIEKGIETARHQHP